jgi:tRNA A-37 threonylcarbamoyl transferase component Bud32
MSETPTPNPEREQQLEQVLAEYLHAEAAGRPLDQDELVAKYPDLAGELTSFFRNRAAVERLAEPLRQQGGTDAPTIGPDDAPGIGAGSRVRYFGDYELLEEIARGGMGVVFKARQTSLHRLVALKMILKGELATPADVQRFQSEARAAANLDHPNIVPIYEVGEHDGQQYFSMKLIEQGTRDKGRGTRESQERTAALLAQVARAVHHAHQRGILHRDLKPSNVLIDRRGEPHVADFGLAKHLEAGPGYGSGGNPTQTGAIVGTPAYMAPEQAKAEKSLTTAVDIYSLGVILYEWLTGRPPFRGDDPISTLMQVVSDEPERLRAVDATIDRDLETICLKCLEKEPAQRYGSAAALADDLDRWQRGEPIEARSAGRAERLWRWGRRNPVLAGLTTAVLALLIAVAVGSTAAAIRIAAARDDAWQAQQRETGERLRAESNADETKKRLARQYVSNAVRAFDDGDYYGALPWLVEALRQDEGKPEREAMQRLRIGSVLQECPKLTQLWFPPGEVIDLAFVGEQLRAVVANGANALVWDALTGEPLSSKLPLVNSKAPQDGRPDSASFRADGKCVAVATAGQEYRIHVWDLTVPKQVCVIGATEAACTSIQGTYTADGKRILVQERWPANPYNFAGRTYICDAETGKVLTPAQPTYGTSDGWLQDALGGQSLLSKDGRVVVTLSRGGRDGMGCAYRQTAFAGRFAAGQGRGACLDADDGTSRGL